MTPLTAPSGYANSGTHILDFSLSLGFTYGATHWYPLDSQHQGVSIYDDGPILPPTSALPKPYFAIKPWAYAWEYFALTTTLYWLR